MDDQQDYELPIGRRTSHSHSGILWVLLGAEYSTQFMRLLSGLADDVNIISGHEKLVALSMVAAAKDELIAHCSWGTLAKLHVYQAYVPKLPSCTALAISEL